MLDNKQLFAQNLKAARKKAGLSQVKLAEMLSYTGKAVSKWESGLAFPPSEILPELAKILDTDLNSLFDFREEASYFLGVDGGGTKTKFILTDKSGKVLKQLTLGACNPTSVGIETTITVMNDGIKQILNDIPFGKVSVHIGSAGCGIASNREAVESSLSKYCFSKLCISNDAENIISAGLNRSDGIIAIMGTGSIIYSSVNGQRHRIGGYGHFIGDIFSGSELGRCCLEAVFADLDSSGSKTVLTEIVTKKVGNDVNKIITDMYAQGKTYMAQFAFDVFDAAEQGDKVALDIIKSNANEFATKLLAAIRRFPNQAKTVPVILAGGVTKKADRFIPMLLGQINDIRLKSIEILDKEPVIGAVLLAGANDVKEN